VTFAGGGGSADNRNWIDRYENRVKPPVEPKQPREPKPRVAPLWNRRKYDKWIKEMSWREETVLYMRSI
jgi:hypothetical protein